MTSIKYVNLGLAFLLELVALGAFGYWGFRTGGTLPVKILLSLGSMVLLTLFWGVFVAPKAVIATSQSVHHLLAMIVFTLAAWVLYATGHPRWAVIFILVSILNRGLLIVWRQ